MPWFWAQKSQLRKDNLSFSSVVMHKDLHLMALTAYENGVSMPSGNLVKEIFCQVNQAGLGDKDFSVIFEHITSGK